MRCPKCSFISFDQVETCAKCGKNISAAAEQLHGTTVSMPAPAFLKYEFDEPEAQQEPEAVEEETAAMETGEEEFVDFSMDDADTPEVDLGADEVEMDLGAEETVEEDEPVIDLGAEEPEEAIDISGLAPSEESELEIEPDVEEELETVTDEIDEVEAVGAEVREGQGLENLKVDIDLEESEAPKGKVMPSVKTGTALDDFDIDLGDLLTSKKD